MCYVLIVDDSEESNNKIEELIQQHFINVILLPIASNKTEALKISEQHLIEIAIINVDLSNTDCFELIKNLLNKYPNLKTILTSYTKDFEKIQQAIRYGVIDYLIKPIDESFIFSLDRAIKSIHQVSLYNEGEAKRKIDDPDTNILIKKMFTYIHDNFQNDINLTSLAKYMHFNQQYTSKFFKEQVGMNFVTYLIHLRIEKAKKLLSTSQMSITDISNEVGYSESAYFTRVFKKNTGHTPQNYRKLFKGEQVIINQQQ